MERSHGEIAWSSADQFIFALSLQLRKNLFFVVAELRSTCTQELWKHFDADGEGFIQFDEFCPEIASVLASQVFKFGFVGAASGQHISGNCIGNPTAYDDAV